MTKQANQIIVPSVQEFRETQNELKSFSLRQLDYKVGDLGLTAWEIEHGGQNYTLHSADKPLYPLAVFKHNESDYLVSLVCGEAHQNLSVVELGVEGATPIVNNEKILAAQFKNAELMKLLRFISRDLFYLDFTDLDAKVDAKTYEINTLLCSVKFTGELVESKDGVDSYDIIVKDVKQRFVHDKVNDKYDFLAVGQ